MDEHLEVFKTFLSPKDYQDTKESLERLYSRLELDRIESPMAAQLLEMTHQVQSEDEFEILKKKLKVYNDLPTLEGALDYDFIPEEGIPEVSSNHLEYVRQGPSGGLEEVDGFGNVVGPLDDRLKPTNGHPAYGRLESWDSPLATMELVFRGDIDDIQPYTGEPNRVKTPMIPVPVVKTIDPSIDLPKETVVKGSTSGPLNSTVVSGFHPNFYELFEDSFEKFLIDNQEKIKDPAEKQQPLHCVALGIPGVGKILLYVEEVIQEPMCHVCILDSSRSSVPFIPEPGLEVILYLDHEAEEGVRVLYTGTYFKYKGREYISFMTPQQA